MGLKKIHLNHLLRQYTGCGLASAKHAVDDLLDGASLSYDFPDQESASAFCRSADEIGAEWNGNKLCDNSLRQ